jgi:hypothetical protein
MKSVFVDVFTGALGDYSPYIKGSMYSLKRSAVDRPLYGFSALIGY